MHRVGLKKEVLMFFILFALPIPGTAAEKIVTSVTLRPHTVPGCMQCPFLVTYY